jgi:RimJ/RimL family protein N-acetyltransferase
MTCGPHSLQETRAFHREAVAQAGTPTRTSFDLAVVDIESRALIGSAALSITNTEHRRGEIGYVLHPDVWSKGLAAEAARIALRRAG